VGPPQGDAQREPSVPTVKNLQRICRSTAVYHFPFGRGPNFRRSAIGACPFVATLPRPFDPPGKPPNRTQITVISRSARQGAPGAGERAPGAAPTASSSIDGFQEESTATANIGQKQPSPHIGRGRPAKPTKGSLCDGPTADWWTIPLDRRTFPMDSCAAGPQLSGRRLLPGSNSRSGACAEAGAFDGGGSRQFLCLGSAPPTPSKKTLSSHSQFGGTGDPQGSWHFQKMGWFGHLHLGPSACCRSNLVIRVAIARGIQGGRKPIQGVPARFRLRWDPGSFRRERGAAVPFPDAGARCAFPSTATILAGQMNKNYVAVGAPWTRPGANHHFRITVYVFGWPLWQAGVFPDHTQGLCQAVTRWQRAADSRRSIHCWVQRTGKSAGEQGPGYSWFPISKSPGTARNFLTVALVTLGDSVAPNPEPHTVCCLVTAQAKIVGPGALPRPTLAKSGWKLGANLVHLRYVHRRGRPCVGNPPRTLTPSGRVGQAAQAGGAGASCPSKPAANTRVRRWAMPTSGQKNGQS